MSKRLLAAIVGMMIALFTGRSSAANPDCFPTRCTVYLDNSEDGLLYLSASLYFIFIWVHTPAGDHSCSVFASDPNYDEVRWMVHAAMGARTATIPPHYFWPWLNIDLNAAGQCTGLNLNGEIH